MSAIPEPFADTRRNGHGSRNVKDQSHGSAMKHTASVAQLLRYREAHDVARLVRIAACRGIGNRFDLEFSRKDSIVALQI